MITQCVNVPRRRNFLVDKIIWSVILSDMTHDDVVVKDLIARLPERIEGDPEWALASRYWNGRLSLTAGTDRVTYDIEEGRLRRSGGDVGDDPGDVDLRAPVEVWLGMLAATPQPFLHDPWGAAYHGFEMVGNAETIAQQAPAIRRLVDLLREAAAEVPLPPAPVRPPGAPRWEKAVGRYLHVDLGGVDHRVYVEEAGRGVPVLLQHTAGADGRQWRHLLDHDTLTERYRFIAYDLPFHGKSIPPTSLKWWTQEYQLTREFLMSVPLAVSAALELDRPIYMGCSIGGHLAVDLAYYHPGKFRAVIGLEAAMKQEPEVDVSLLYHPRVSNEYKATAMYGLTSPTAPEAFRRETAFVYSQGAPPTFSGDLYYWQIDHDLRGLASQIETSRCEVHLLTGEYDWATPVPLSQQLAEEIPSATFQVMSGLGHFPMSEDPERFVSYVEPVLDAIGQSVSAPAVR